MVVMYGGAPPLTGPWPPVQPFEPVPTTPPNTAGRELLAKLGGLAQGVHIRVCAMAEVDGTLKLKVYCDGKLIAEVTGSHSLSLETDVGGTP